jgi:hypothetical protein
MIALHIDTAGGSNFEGYHLRNVLTLHVGGSALAATTLQVTGTLGVSGAVTLSSTLAVTGVLTMTGHIVATVIRNSTSDAADNSQLEITGGGAVSATGTRGALIQLAGNEHASLAGSVRIMAGNIANGEVQIYTGNTIRLQIFDNGAVSLVPSTNPGVAGDILIPNARSLFGRNNAGNGNIAMLNINSNDELFLAPAGGDIKWGRPEIALGGGASATLGTIGGSGPSNAAQNGWLRVINSTGSPVFVPSFL